jgi:hypothetical protein
LATLLPLLASAIASGTPSVVYSSVFFVLSDEPSIAVRAIMNEKKFKHKEKLPSAVQVYGSK